MSSSVDLSSRQATNKVMVAVKLDTLNHAALWASMTLLTHYPANSSKAKFHKCP